MINQIKKLVVNECACYSSISNNIKDYCDKEQEEDCRCRIFKDKKCGYFERAVLPMNPQLEALYKANDKGYKITKEDKESISFVRGKVRIRCKKCGKLFLANNYRQKYCKICKRYICRENNRNTVAKNREESKQSACQDR